VADEWTFRNLASLELNRERQITPSAKTDPVIRTLSLMNRFF
jgi:hypothetical protein